MAESRTPPEWWLQKNPEVTEEPIYYDDTTTKGYRKQNIINLLRDTIRDAGDPDYKEESHPLPEEKEPGFYLPHSQIVMSGASDAPLPGIARSTKVADNDYELPPDLADKAFGNVPKPGGVAALAATQDKPDDAAKAVQLGSATGVSPSVIYPDIDHFNQMVRGQSAGAIVANNRHLSDFVTADPMHAKLAADDFANLDHFSQAASDLAKPGVFESAAKWYQGAKGELGQTAQAMGQGFTKEFDFPGQAQELDKLYHYIDSPVWRAIFPALGLVGEMAQLLQNVPAGVIGAGAAAVSSLYQRYGGSEADVANLARDLTIMAQVSGAVVPEAGLAAKANAAIRAAKAQGDIIPPGVAFPDELLKDVTPAAEAARAVVPYIEQGRDPPVGLHPEVDKVKKEEADVDLKRLQIAFKGAQASKMLERSPEHFEDFASRHFGPGATVGIDYPTLLKYYAYEPPSPGDGILGFVPDIAQQWALSQQTGADIQVPIAGLLTYMDPTVFKELEKGIRWRPEGVTTGEELPEAGSYPKEEPVQAKLEEIPPEQVAGGVEPPKAPPPTGGAVPPTPAQAYPDAALFATAHDIDLTIPIAKKLQAAIVEANQAIYQARLKRAEEFEKKRQTPEWKANRAEMREGVAQEIALLPRHIADAGMRSGEMPKFSASALTEWQKEALGRRYYETDGMLPDRIASLIGANSGDELIQDLINLRANYGDISPDDLIKKLTDDETDRRMEEVHGNLAKNITDAAEEQALMPQVLDLQHAKIEALGNGMGIAMPYTKEQIKANVAKNIGNQLARDVFTRRFLRAAEKTDRDLLKAGAEQDPLALFHAWEQRYEANLNAVEAKKLDKMKKFVDGFLKRFSKREVKGYAQEYVDQIHAVMNRLQFGVRPMRLPSDIAANMAKNQQPDLASFVSQMQGMMYNLHVPDYLLDPEFKKTAAELTVDEFRGLHDFFKAMKKQARLANQIVVGGKAYDYEETFQKMLEQIKSGGGVERKLMPEMAHKPYTENEVNDGLRKYGWAAILLESGFRSLDRWDPDGIFNRMIVRRYSEDANYKERLSNEVAKMLRKVPEPKDLDKIVDNPNLFMDRYANEQQHADIPLVLTRRNFLGVLLHMGNESNFTKLTKGWNIASPGVFKQWVYTHATEADWEWARSIGRVFKHLGDLADNMSFEWTDVGLHKVPTPDISYMVRNDKTGQWEQKTGEGWYAPVKYTRNDPNAPKINPNGLMQKGFYLADTPQGYTNSRTQFWGPVELNASGVPIVMKQMIHDIAMRPTAITLGKLFWDQRFLKAIERYYSPTFANMLKPFLKDAVNMANDDSEISFKMNQVANAIVRNVVSYEIGFNPGTVMKHFFSAAAASLQQVGVVPWTYELVKIISNPAYAKMLYDESDEMNRRISFVFNQLHGTSELRLKGYDKGAWNTLMDFRAASQYWAQVPVGLSDLFSSLPTYAAARNKALAQDPTDLGRAKFLGEQAVRLAHGSSIITNRPQIMRSHNPYANSFATIMGFYNEGLNKTFEAGGRARYAIGLAKQGETSKAVEQGRIATSIMFTRLAFTALVEEMVTGGGDPREGLMSRSARMLLEAVGGRFFLIRDAVWPVLHGGEPTAGQISEAIRAPVGVARDLAKGDAFSEAKAGKTIRDINFLLAVAGAGTNAAEGKAAQYVINLMNDRDRADGPWQFAVGLNKGRTRGYSRTFIGALKQRGLVDEDADE